MGGVVDDRDAGLIRNRVERVAIRGQSGEMDGNNRLGLPGDSAADVLGSETERDRVDVREDDLGPLRAMAQD